MVFFLSLKHYFFICCSQNRSRHGLCHFDDGSYFSGAMLTATGGKALVWNGLVFSGGENFDRLLGDSASGLGRQTNNAS